MFLYNKNTLSHWQYSAINYIGWDKIKSPQYPAWCRSEHISSGCNLSGRGQIQLLCRARRQKWEKNSKLIIKQKTKLSSSMCTAVRFFVCSYYMCVIYRDRFVPRSWILAPPLRSLLLGPKFEDLYPSVALKLFLCCTIYPKFYFLLTVNILSQILISLAFAYI